MYVLLWEMTVFLVIFSISTKIPRWTSLLVQLSIIMTPSLGGDGADDKDIFAHCSFNGRSLKREKMFLLDVATYTIRKRYEKKPN